MPIHDYACITCGEVREFRTSKFVKCQFDYCKRCGLSKRFEQIFSPSCCFTLKGEGWAKDGYNKTRKRELV